LKIKTSWVALVIVVLSVGLLLVASREGSLFSNRSAPPGTNVSAEPTVTTPTPSSTPPGTTAAAPAPLPSEHAAPTGAAGLSAPAPPAPSAVAPSTVPPTTPPAATAAAPAAPTPTASTPSEQPARPPAPTPAGPSTPAPPAPAAVAPPAAAPPAATVAPQPAIVLPAEAEMSTADRRQVQEALHRLDHYNGPVDGIFGPLTRAAIRRFQQGIGSDATGYLTANQASRLVAPR
jgi:outer membrane biosynthesis protein TonB